jgi:hypothetical protein
MSNSNHFRTAVAVSVATLLASCGVAGQHVAITSDGRQVPANTSPATPSSTGDHTGGGIPRRVFDHGRFEQGATYRAAGELQDIDVVFNGPSSALFAVIGPHYIGMSLDRQGVNPVVSIRPIAGLRVFPSPAVDPADLADDVVGKVTKEAPADIISWLASTPFLINHGIEQGFRIGDLVGRGFTYSVGELPETSRACGPAPAPRCAATIWASGVTHHVTAGETGRMAQVDVAGQPLLVMATDGPGTDELLSSLHFETPTIPTQAGTAERLPYLASLEPGSRYLIDKIGKTTGLVTTAPAAPVVASQRKDLAWFGDPAQSSASRHYYLVAFDAHASAANADPSLDPYKLVGPTGIVLWQLGKFLSHLQTLPDDPIAWLSAQPYLRVVRQARATHVAGQVAQIIDVQATPSHGGFPCPDGRGTCVMPFAHMADAFPMVISSEYATRFVDLAVGGEHVLIAADLGTPGEPLLAGLCAFTSASGSNPQVGCH